MEKEFEIILDECVDRINHGDKLEECLTDYPEYAAQLEPLLKAMTQTQVAFNFTPSDNAKRLARQRLYTALEKKRQPSIWQQILSHRRVLATTVSVLVLLLVSYFGLRTIMNPEGQQWEYVTEPTPGSPNYAPPISEYIASANVNGNFAFLVSDEVNAIADFSSLKVTVDRVGLLQSGNSEHWIEFSPEIKEFDLTLLPGEKTQELWRGNIPEGQYNKVFIYITGIQGTLKASGETIDIKVPSNKLQISMPFQVSANNVTSFTYDLTVVSTGNGKNSGKYLLKPQITESGASQNPLPKYQPEKNKKAALPADTSAPLYVTNNRKK